MQRTSVICSVIWRAGRGAVALVLALATLVAFAGPAWADTHMDESFSEDGARILNRTSKNDEARSLAFRSDGSVVLGGWDDNNHSSWKALRMVTIAIAADGTGSGPFCGSSSCDPKTDRKTWSPLTDSAEEVLLLSDGRYAFVGHAGDSGNKYDCVVVVRDTDASLDTSFASNGKSDVRFSTSENDQCYAGALQSDGKIVVGGWVYTSSSTGRNLALARVNPSDGSLDTSFGSGGKVVYNAGGNGEHIKAIDVQPDGKILVAGTTNAGTSGSTTKPGYPSSGNAGKSRGPSCRKEVAPPPHPPLLGKRATT